MRKILISLCCCLFLSGFLQKKTLLENSPTSSFPVSDTLVLLFAGDVMGHAPQYKAAYCPETKNYRYDICFENVKRYVATADFAVCNLEVPLAGEPYSGYPNFSSPDELLDALKSAGYNIILTANNHAADRGTPGIDRTIRTLMNRKMNYAGTYLNEKQRDTLYPLLLEKNNLKIAILNYTYGTNGRVVDKPYLVNMLDTLLISNDIKIAKARGANFIVACVHWGEEYFTHSNATQQKMARWLVARDVDLIIGGHPHVVQEVDFIQNKNAVPVPVFYSLGNYISNQRKINTDGGIMTRVKIDMNTRKILSTEYLPVYVHKGILREKYQYHLIPTPDFVSCPACFPIPSSDSLALMTFDKNTRERLPKIPVFPCLPIHLLDADTLE
ncbi:MAG: CapA family protein [Bacteroidales bacterium]|jgi:poly-gamma-glutamate synthesis protein (capsule biosynthesis protein)|nr:CapA family protein [Bacteroidales bacterium]